MKFFSVIPMQKSNYYKLAIPWFALQGVYVWRLYDHLLQRKLHRFKFAHNTVDSTYFEAIFRELITEIPDHFRQNCVIVYPPISLKDRILRGPNHAKRLAKILVHCLGNSAHSITPFYKNFFAGHQSRRCKTQRKKIVQEYRFNPSFQAAISQKNIIFVDDIITTGYTAYALGKLLKKNWSWEIVGIFLASHKI